MFKNFVTTLKIKLNNKFITYIYHLFGLADLFFLSWFILNFIRMYKTLLFDDFYFVTITTFITLLFSVNVTVYLTGIFFLPYINIKSKLLYLLMGISVLGLTLFILAFL